MKIRAILFCYIISASSERLMDVYERLDHLDASSAEKTAGYLLHGLGFTRTMQHTKVF